MIKPAPYPIGIFKDFPPETWYTIVASQKTHFAKGHKTLETEQWVHNSDFLKGQKTKGTRAISSASTLPTTAPLQQAASLPSLCFNPEQSSVSIFQIFFLCIFIVWIIRKQDDIMHSVLQPVVLSFSNRFWTSFHMNKCVHNVVGEVSQETDPETEICVHEVY